ncbi:MAG: Eco57I restriction-modification methylase domain-containing protein [Planctomycetota bacterium]|nr:Eco57I restriction-modification methylase domain-containing protein [Planctomycetota bacterium]
MRRGIIAAGGSVIPESVLPDFVQKGMHDPKARTFERRYNLGGAVIPGPAGANLALPTETWREYVERRRRCLELRARLAAGEVRDVNDLITYNLDIRQFAQDVVENAEGPDLLVAFWNAIAGRMPEKSNETGQPAITVLDLACGSGAFLFAALNILEPLYEACLQRMEAFLEEWGDAGRKRHPNYHKLFTETLARVAEHPNSRYFILKSIVIQNLYGVDIMDEAVEICKLRLFLKLVAQVETAEKIEPLPDIDFNIRAGNTLVGFASEEAVRKAFSGQGQAQATIQFGEDTEALRRFGVRLADAQQGFDAFRSKQLEGAGIIPPSHKEELQRRLDELRRELDILLASDYGINESKIPNKKQYGEALEQWRKSHQPFHWFGEFYGTMRKGGFDVIVGNPPYLELREVDYEPKGFASFESKAIHAMFVERGALLLHRMGCMSMVVPLSVVSTQRMLVVQQMLEEKRNCWYANFSWRPGKMFDTVNRALTVFAVTPSGAGRSFSTGYQKWASDNRDLLIPCMRYVEVPRNRAACWVPKLCQPVETAILKKCLNVKTSMADFMANSANRVYHRTTGGLYWKVFTDFAPAFRVNGRAGHSTRETWFSLEHKGMVRPAIAALSSDIFWWWYTITTNCRDLNPYDIKNFPIPAAALQETECAQAGGRYLADLQRNSTMLVRQQSQTGRTETQCFKIQKCKTTIGEIDCVFAKHYGFTDEELDFIINYDIKYRMGGGEDYGGDE